jgi:uncharacterized membrane protein
MGPDTYSWLVAAHLIAVFLWLGTMFAVYWLLRIHAHAPKDVLDKLTLMERSLALSMDIAATVAIGCGIAMAVGRPGGNLFSAPGSGWFHIKLAVVVLGILPVHGMLRGKIKKFSNGQLSPIPQWMWSLVLAAITVIVILVVRGPIMFAK